MKDFNAAKIMIIMSTEHDMTKVDKHLKLLKDNNTINNFLHKNKIDSDDIKTTLGILANYLQQFQ
jgi:hypothetical protein